MPHDFYSRCQPVVSKWYWSTILKAFFELEMLKKPVFSRVSTALLNEGSFRVQKSSCLSAGQSFFRKWCFMVRVLSNGRRINWVMEVLKC